MYVNGFRTTIKTDTTLYDDGRPSDLPTIIKYPGINNNRARSLRFAIYGLYSYWNLSLSGNTRRITYNTFVIRAEVYENVDLIWHESRDIRRTQTTYCITFIISDDHIARILYKKKNAHNSTYNCDVSVRVSSLLYIYI